MSVESLPYTLLLLLAQLTAGVAALVFFVLLRGTFQAGFIRACSWIIVACAVMTTAAAMVVDPTSSVENYALDASLLDPIRAVAMAQLLFSLVFLVYVRRTEEPFLAFATGATTVGLGAILLVLLASLVRIPAWSVAGPLLTLFTGAAILGSSTVAMVWGHWYLVNPKLEEGPLNQLVLITLAAILLGLVATAINAIIPVGSPFESNALLAIDLPQNPGFWLRIGLGLIFPAGLAFLAFVSSRERSMMSATGLLYIAVGSVLAGEAVARGLMFVTGAPV